MNVKSALAGLTIFGAAIAFAAEGWRADIAAPYATGGVARATCRVGTLSRLDYALDRAGKLELVRSVGGVELSATTITNAAAAASGTVASLGVVGAEDYLRLTAATNTSAKIYVITQ